MKIIVALLLNLGTYAQAAPLNVYPVGDDGGFRVSTACFMSQSNTNCPIDTASPFSVVSLMDINQQLPSEGRSDLSSIGLSLKCDLVKIPDFQMLGVNSPNLTFHRCENLPSLLVLIGLNFFVDRSFVLDFKNNTLDLDAKYRGPTHSLQESTNSYPPAQKLVIPGQVGTENISIAFDTGAPVTLVDQHLVDRHPEIFVESTKPPSEMMKRRGLRRFEMHGPFVVNGFSLKAEFVHTGDLNSFSQGEYPVLLGVNHMKNANWFFDLTARTWAIY